jgi:hypothetical protein
LGSLLSSRAPKTKLQLAFSGPTESTLNAAIAPSSFLFLRSDTLAFCARVEQQAALAHLSPACLSVYGAFRSARPGRVRFGMDQEMGR